LLSFVTILYPFSPLSSSLALITYQLHDDDDERHPRTLKMENFFSLALFFCSIHSIYEKFLAPGAQMIKKVFPSYIPSSAIAAAAVPDARDVMGIHFWLIRMLALYYNPLMSNEFDGSAT
jgi:hypothetical protein